MAGRGFGERERALLVLIEQVYDPYRDDRAGGGTRDGQQLVVKAHAVTCEIDGSNIRNGSHYDEPGHVIKGISGDDLQGFWARCSADREDGEIRYEHQKVEYADTLMTINGQRAAGMVKVFKAVERTLERLAHKYGWHTSSGQYLVRVAQAIGATRIIVRKRDATMPGSTYDENAACYAHYEPSAALDVVNARIAEWAAGATEQQAPRLYY